jgi:hypothetical protein
MTAAELIRELQAVPPDIEVRIVLREVWHADEQGEIRVHLCDDDAEIAEEIRRMGGHVLIRGR